MKFAPLFAIFLLSIFTGFVKAEPNAQEILYASDAIRNPDKPFGLTVTLIEYRNNVQTDSNTLALLSRIDPKTGQYLSLIDYVAPLRDSGKLLLKNGDDLWFYDPSSKASVRISPQQRLLGQASNGDVVTVTLAKDYKAVLVGEESIKDGDQQVSQCYKLSLDPLSPNVTYFHIEMWVRTSNSRPVKARFYSESNHLLKTSFYRNYQNNLGMERPGEIVIIDGLDPGWVTVMRYSDYAFKDTPESWFQRDFLPNFKLE